MTDPSRPAATTLAPADVPRGTTKPAEPAAAAAVPDAGAPLLAAEDLSVTVPGPAGPQQVLDHLSLTLHPGELLTVTGRTGSGKSTLLRLLVGQTRPQAGRVTWEGRDLASLRDHQLAAARRGFLGYLDQANPVVEGLTAREHLLLGAGPVSRRRRPALGERVTDVAGRLCLTQVLDRDVSLLSGGERQRVALGTLLLGDPRVLVLDEPTSALDAATTRAVVAALRRLCGQDVGVLVATHDPLLIEAADRALPVDEAR